MAHTFLRSTICVTLILSQLAFVGFNALAINITKTSTSQQYRNNNNSVSIKSTNTTTIVPVVPLKTIKNETKKAENVKKDVILDAQARYQIHQPSETALHPANDDAILLVAHQAKNSTSPSSSSSTMTKNSTQIEFFRSLEAEIPPFNRHITQHGLHAAIPSHFLLFLHISLPIIGISLTILFAFLAWNWVIEIRGHLRRSAGASQPLIGAQSSPSPQSSSPNGGVDKRNRQRVDNEEEWITTRL